MHQNRKFLTLVTVLIFNMVLPEDILSSDQADLLEQPQQTAIRILSTPEEHRYELRESFRQAQESILIISYGQFYRGKYLNATVGALRSLLSEVKDGVKVYYYYNYDKEDNSFDPIPPKVKSLFDEYRVKFEEVSTHAKMVMVDDKKVIIGSHSWFSLGKLVKKDKVLERSIVYEGNFAPTLSGSIWNVLMYYRNRDFAKKKYWRNQRKATRWKRNPYFQKAKIYDLNEKTQLTYIPTIEAHRLKLLDMFKQAKERIIIASPFVTYDGKDTYQRDWFCRIC